jgi:hypothetical protein
LKGKLKLRENETSEKHANENVKLDIIHSFSGLSAETHEMRFFS